MLTALIFAATIHAAPCPCDTMHHRAIAKYHAVAQQKASARKPRKRSYLRVTDAQADPAPPVVPAPPSHVITRPIAAPPAPPPAPRSEPVPVQPPPALMIFKSDCDCDRVAVQVAHDLGDGYPWLGGVGFERRHGNAGSRVSVFAGEALASRFTFDVMAFRRAGNATAYAGAGVVLDNSRVTDELVLTASGSAWVQACGKHGKKTTLSTTATATVRDTRSENVWSGEPSVFAGLRGRRRDARAVPFIEARFIFSDNTRPSLAAGVSF